MFDCNDWGHGTFCVINDWNGGIDNVGTELKEKLRINEMKLIPDVHTELSSLKVIRPDSSFDESPGSVIAERINGKSQFSKADWGIRIKLIEPDLSNGSRKHMADIPPRKDENRHANEDQKFYHFNNLK